MPTTRGTAAVAPLRRVAKYRWLLEHKIKMEDGCAVWCGTWSDVPRCGTGYSQHYADFRIMERDGYIRVDRPKHMRDGQRLTIWLVCAPPIYVVAKRNRSECPPAAKPLPCDSSDGWIAAPTAAAYKWLRRQAVDGVWCGTAKDIPQGDMSYQSAKRCLQRLCELGMIRRVSEARGYRTAIYEVC